MMLAELLSPSRLNATSGAYRIHDGKVGLDCVVCSREVDPLNVEVVIFTQYRKKYGIPYAPDRVPPNTITYQHECW